VGLEILPEEGQDLILAGALLSIVINPLLFSWLDRRVLRMDLAANAALDAEAGIPEGLSNHAILVGYGRVGRELARLLQERGVPLVLIEADRDRVTEARKQGFTTIFGNAAAEAVLKEARPDTAQLAILAVPQALEAGEVVARMKATNPEITVLARAHSEAEVKHLLDHGADAAVLAERELAYSLADMVMATPPYRPARVEAVPAAG